VGMVPVLRLRPDAQLTVTIHTAKPRIVIGKGGSSVDQLREDLEKRFGNRVRISIQEIKQPELDAQLVAENIASQIERRISYKRAMKQAILRTMRAGAKGVRIYCGGRLRGAEMARREWDREGRVPLHTLRADIDFGRATAKTTFGAIGVKCWIYKDQITPKARLPIADGAPIGEAIAPQPEAPVSVEPAVLPVPEATVPEPVTAEVAAPAAEPKRARAPRAAAATTDAAPKAETATKTTRTAAKPAAKTAKAAEPKTSVTPAVKKAPAKKATEKKKS
jgi:small subunit ribosomal protein S3